MSDDVLQKEYRIQNTVYSLRKMQGRVTEIGIDGQKRTMRVRHDADLLDFSVPWHVDVGPEHELSLVYAQNTEDAGDRRVYYIYDHSTETMELNDTHPKPNTSFGLALLDFILVILLGMAMARPVFALSGDNSLWGLGGLCIALVLLYMLIHWATTSLFYSQAFAQTRRMNEGIKEMASS